MQQHDSPWEVCAVLDFTDHHLDGEDAEHDQTSLVMLGLFARELPEEVRKEESEEGG